MTERFDSYGIEMQFNGTDWVDVSADVIGRYEYTGGIRSGNISDRVAQTGVLSFTMNNNGHTNSGGVDGYYSPGHANCRSGFDVGLPVRVFFFYDDMPQYYYFIIPNDGISVQSGQYGAKRVSVRAHDWMENAANSEVNAVSIATNVRTDEAIPLITASMARPPQTTDYSTGYYTFPTFFDALKPKTRVMSELSKLIRSEFGFAGVIGNSLNGETLLAESQSRRPNLTSPFGLVHDILTTEDGRPLLTEAGVCLGTEVHTDAVFSDSMMSMTPSRGKNIVNRVTASTRPREIKDVAVLFAIQEPIYIDAGETITLVGNYKDPDNQNVYVAGQNMVTPVAGTDYIAYQYKEGSSVLLTSYLVVDADYDTSPSKVYYSIQNTAGWGGWIRTLQARGQAIVLYDPVESLAEDATSQNAYGVQDLSYDMIYQPSRTEGEKIAAGILARYKDPYNDIETMRFHANRSVFLMRAFMQLSQGKRITTDETVTGIDTDFFVNGFGFEVIPGGTVYFTLIPTIPMGWEYLGVSSTTTTVRADMVSFWRVWGKSTTYSTARSTASYNDSSFLSVGQNLDDGDYLVFRSFLKFDTSWLPNGATITSLKMKLAIFGSLPDTDFDIVIQKHDWSGQDPIASGNREAAFDGCLAATSDDNIWGNTAGLSDDTLYESGELDPSHINTSGWTYYSLISNRDRNLSGNIPTDNEGLSFYLPTHATYYPRLEVTWEIP